MSAERSLSKADRHRLIGSVIARRRVGTQMELIDALARSGCHVTQATASRDIRELGLEKIRDPLGAPRYVLPQGGRRPDPSQTLASVLRQVGRQATAAGNIVVVHSQLGSAPAVARALDRVGHPRIVGTLAGDDTCLVVVASAADARALTEELAALIG
jgi:transcriptional regulator of arginine metabolism